jgi:hypothetical protein
MFTNKFKKKSSQKKKTLLGMGFTSAQADHALEAYDGNLERATDYLLSNQGSSSSNSNNNSNRNSDTRQRNGQYSGGSTETEEEQLQRIMAESIQLEEQRNQRTKQPFVSAASLKAGQAAAARAENSNRRFGTNGKLMVKREGKKKSSIGGTKSTSASISASTSTSTNMAVLSTSKAALKDHPNVKMPTQMKDKSKEEQILRCAKRLSTHPFAVDTLLRAFTFIRQNPDDSKYRKIDRSSFGFQSTLEGKPGAMDLIHAMNFVAKSNTMDLVLERNRVDMALLYLGISALEKIRTSSEYKSSKLSITFERELKKIQNGENMSEEEELLKRAQFVQKLPSEPEAGAGALVQVSLGDDKIMRRFDGDDILRDVINFIGGHGSVIPEKITSREWCLVDLNQYPVVPIDTEISIGKTLQFIGCWPSGKLALQPSTVEWKERKEISEKVGSSRGLGAASSS